MRLSRAGWLGFGIVTLGASIWALQTHALARLGRQPDGSFLVSSGQRILPGTIAFDGRVVDIAAHPNRPIAAVMGQDSVFLVDDHQVIPGSTIKLAAGAAFHGLKWTPDGKTLFASLSNGTIARFTLSGDEFKAGPEIRFVRNQKNLRPGGIAITQAGDRLFTTLLESGEVAEVNLATDVVVRTYNVQKLPYDVALSRDEKSLIVANWGGRDLREDEEDEEGAGESAEVLIAADSRNAPASGTISIVDRESRQAVHIATGISPTGVIVNGDRAYVPCAADDTVCEIDVVGRRLARTFRLKWGSLNLFGSMPNALLVQGDRLYVANGGDNALAVLDLQSGRTEGFLPVGFFPIALALAPDGRIWVANAKGNGSVRNVLRGKPGGPHDFQGTVSVVEPKQDLAAATRTVAANNHWDAPAPKPSLKVFNGAIEHVIYVIKENRTYDQIFGDMLQGNGDPKLCEMGENVTPNHHQLAREFALFDNTYVSGTNSAEGHHWTDEAINSSYLEHFYSGYRTYPDDGVDTMANSPQGAIWDQAMKAGKKVRIYGEFCNAAKNDVKPHTNSWFDVWNDRQAKLFRYTAVSYTEMPQLKSVVHPNYLYWPLTQMDQWRADIFIDEFQRMSREKRVPNLIVMTLPCDHTEGRNPNYPTPRAMVADNDLALGRIVEAVSQTPEWAKTCIISIEDDAQAGPDHVDGHRCAFGIYSPYVKRGTVDSTFYTTVSALRTIEMMLGLKPMNRFDATTPPIQACFTDTPDLKPYRHLPNRVPLDERNPEPKSLKGEALFWTQKSMALDWSGIDRADWYWLNRVIWYANHHGNPPYPGDQPWKPDRYASGHGVARTEDAD